MPVSLTVCDLDDELAASLARRAARHGRSSEEEAREILQRALVELPDEYVGPSFDDLAAELRALTAGRTFTPSEVLLRESREER